ncbi:MAG: hypothetical protein P4L69_05980 [Desulfosporosinus sp.]|nr:hypothetical protein [Desulfosporosinus sp.]
MEGVTIYLSGTTVLMIYLSALVFSMFVIEKVMKKPQATRETMTISIDQPIPVCMASSVEEEDSDSEEDDEPLETEGQKEEKGNEEKMVEEKED